MLTFEQVMELIKDERAYQDAKWGTLEEKQQSIPGYLLVLEAEVNEAKLGWLKNLKGRNSTQSELVQVAATAIAALQQHGDAEHHG